MDPVLLAILSDLSVNLTAGWLGAILIVSPFLKRIGKLNLRILTANLLLAIVFLGIAYLLRKAV